jgi:hypothetical protein
MGHARKHPAILSELKVAEMISVWFVNKSDGLPDRTMPARYYKTADEVIGKIRDLKVGRLGHSHYMRITASGGVLSLDDERRLQQAGAEYAPAFLPDVTRPGAL